MYDLQKPLGGIVALSGFQALEGSDEASNGNADVIRQIPLFSYHGGKDLKLLLGNAKRSFEPFKTIYADQYSANCTFTAEANMGHAISPAEIKMVRAWLVQRSSSTSSSSTVKDKPMQPEQQLPSEYHDNEFWNPNKASMAKYNIDDLMKELE